MLEKNSDMDPNSIDESDNQLYINPNRDARSSLRSRVVRGGAWMLISNIANNVSFALALYILARLLTPGDYGLVGILISYNIFINHITELGLGAAIVQRASLQDTHINTVFWTNLFMGLGLCLVSVLIAPLAGKYFHSTNLISAFAITSISFILYSLSVVQRSLLIKSLTFWQIGIAEISSAFSLSIVAAVLALLGAGIFSIVGGMLVRAVVYLLFLWKLSSWRPKREWEYSAFRQMISFGGWVLFTFILTQLYANLDQVIVGGVLGNTMLGFYTLAFQLMTYPRSTLLPILTRTAFPAFSLVQEEENAFRNMYCKMINIIALVMFPLLSLLALVGEDFITVFFGQKWSNSILPLQILCIAGLFYSVYSPSTIIYQAKGRAELGTKQEFLRTMMMFISLIVVVRYGILAVAISVAIYAGISTLFFQRWVNRLIGLRTLDWIGSLWPAGSGSVIMVLSAFVVQALLYAIDSFPPLASLAITCTIGAISYFAYLWIFHRRSLTNIMQLFHLLIPHSTAT
jgi:O-antigen/teichoic acid export membrane protein